MPLSSRRIFAAEAFSVLTIFFAVALIKAWLGDDIFLSLRQVHNVLNGDGLVYNANQRVQVFTSPTWILVLIGMAWATGELFYSTLIASIFFSLAAVAVLLDFIRRHRGGHSFHRRFMMLVVLSLSATQSFSDYTTSGLENALSFFGVGIVAFIALDDSRGEPGRATRVVFFLALALTFLNRFDLALLLLPCALHTVFARWGFRASLPHALPGIAALLAWFGFALIYFGSPLPNTFYAKLGADYPLGQSLQRGFEYGAATLFADPLTVGLLVAGLGTGLFGAHGPARALALGGVFYLIYVVTIGGDFMLGRHFSVPVFLAAFILCAFIASRPGMPRGAGAILALGTVVLILAWAVTLRFQPPARALPGGVVDERGHHHSDNGLWSKKRQWPRPEPLQNFEPVHAEVQCGMMGRAALMDGGVFWVDGCGMSDPFLARLPAIRDPAWRIGHPLRKIPGNYLLARLNNLPLADSSLQSLFDDVRRVERDPLFSAERWAAIGRLNLFYPRPFDRERYANPDISLPRVVPLVAVDPIHVRDKLGAFRHETQWLASFIPFERALRIGVQPPKKAAGLKIALTCQGAFAILANGQSVQTVPVRCGEKRSGSVAQTTVHFPQPMNLHTVEITVLEGDARQALGMFSLLPAKGSQ
jgi:arabinofuranosyltransferase